LKDNFLRRLISLNFTLPLNRRAKRERSQSVKSQNNFCINLCFITFPRYSSNFRAGRTTCGAVCAKRIRKAGAKGE
jgi:hypothetical protein